MSNFSFLYLVTNARGSRRGYPSQVDCPDSLCDRKPIGTLFRLSEQQPNYFVTCTNEGVICRKCQYPLVFDTRITACVDSKGSSTRRTTPQTRARTRTTTTTTLTIKTPKEAPAMTTEKTKATDVDCKFFPADLLWKQLSSFC